MKLVTKSCVLRAPTPDDAPSLAKYANNRNVWLTVRDIFPHPYSLQDAQAYIERIAEQAPRTNFIIDVGGEACGSIALHGRTDVERISAELGYWLGEPFWGRGITTEAVGAITDYGFRELPLKRIFAIPVAHNVASQRVLEKNGYEREAIMRNACIKDGKILDMMLYARIVP